MGRRDRSRSPHDASETISRTVSGFGRYPHKRPSGLELDAEGRFTMDNLMDVWGFKAGYSEKEVTNAINKHQFYYLNGTVSDAPPRFTLGEDDDGRTTIQVRIKEKNGRRRDRDHHSSRQYSWRDVRGSGWAKQEKEEEKQDQRWKGSKSSWDSGKQDDKWSASKDDDKWSGSKDDKWSGSSWKDRDWKDSDKWSKSSSSWKRDDDDRPSQDDASRKAEKKPWVRHKESRGKPGDLPTMMGSITREPAPEADPEKPEEPEEPEEDDEDEDDPLETKEELDEEDEDDDVVMVKQEINDDGAPPEPPGDRPGKYWQNIRENGEEFWLYKGPKGCWKSVDRDATPEQHFS
eukprot:TRINITY_DN513_c0_g1_i1.p1 TRINITY_DN513_c0_g1~~TRINITY_DN513_c0_g1_i1.p1  ORF type:complete len:347 (+),score=92.41 TRINITY_DN513_c0_g1_i1:92-1132(+)